MAERYEVFSSMEVMRKYGLVLTTSVVILIFGAVAASSHQPR